ncbi:MAG: hypothetical protein PHI33_09240 [Smithellaceae bacterium]|nr:hypothetical protein [Smithellaceae bacterium]
MEKKQYVEYAVFAAEQVAHLWKAKYPAEYKIWKDWADAGCSASSVAKAASAASAAADAENANRNTYARLEVVERRMGMSGKQSCENCGNQDTITACQAYHRNDMWGCKYWHRNPHLWLDILPSEPGWYWYRVQAKSVVWMVNVHTLYNGLHVGEDTVKELGGLWQGPIAPEE